MAKRGSAATIAADVVQRLRGDVLDGALPPGTRLKPAEIAARFGVSTGVVREALTSLVGQGLVDSEHNRGYSVVTLSARQLSDLTEFRIVVEQLALRMTIDRGDLVWESELVAAHHRLSVTPRRDPERPDRTTEEWSEAHRAFHRTLVGACGYDPLAEQCARLNDRAEVYRRWSAPAAGGARDVDAEHARLVEAALARDAGRATAELRSHYEATARILLASPYFLTAD